MEFLGLVRPVSGAITAPVLHLPRSDEEMLSCGESLTTESQAASHYWWKHGATNIDGMGKLMKYIIYTYKYTHVHK